MILIIQGGRVLDPARGLDGPADVAVVDGVIKSVGPGAGEAFFGENLRVLDATGMLVLPGLVDMHVHLREPGQEYKETVATGTRAASSSPAWVPCPSTSTMRKVRAMSRVSRSPGVMKPVNGGRALSTAAASAALSTTVTKGLPSDW